MPEPQGELEPLALRLVAAGDTHIGSRMYNEDSILIRSDLHLFVVADGAGGHNAGNVASALACTAVGHFYEDSETEAMGMPEFDSLGLSTEARRLAASIQHANHEIVQVAKSSDRHRGMGTTVVALRADPRRGVVHIAHVGDSRCYRLRDLHLELLTNDHTLVNDVLELRPDIPDAEAAKLPKNVITRALGMNAGVRVSVRSHEVAPGDRFLLCTDGLSDELDDLQIAEALMVAKSPEEQTRLLIDLANKDVAKDNIGVVVVACELVPGATTLPKPHAIRVPRGRHRVTPPPTADVQPPKPDQELDDEFPEIIVVEPGTEDDIAVVPRQARESVIQSMRVFLSPKHREALRKADEEEKKRRGQ